MYRNAKDYEIELKLVNFYKTKENEIIDKIVEFLHISDFLYNNQDEKYFKYLYCGCNNIAENNQTSICLELFLSESSLRRYRKRYVKLAKYFMEGKSCQPFKN